MNLLKTSFYTSASTIITFLSGFISIKIVAVKIGPDGIAQLGQYQSITALIAIIGSASISVGLTKYLAEFRDDLSKKQRLISTAISFVIFTSLLTGLMVVIFSRTLSVKSFNVEKYWVVYLLYGCLLVLISLNVVFSSIYNGLKEIKKLTIVNISAALAGVVFTVSLATAYGLFGVLIAGNCTALVLFLVNAGFFRKIPVLKFRPSVEHFDKKILLLLLSFTAVSLITNALIPVNQLFIRDFIIEKLGFTQAGYWQGMTRISDYYLLFITTVLGVYFLPVLSELKDESSIRKEVLSGYKIILPAVACLAAGIYLFRSLVIRILFTDSFDPMNQLFLFQMIGDFLKIGGWLLGYLMAAKAMLKTIVVLEIVFTSFIIVLTRIFVKRYGLVGTTYAFALNYALYWLTTAIIMRRYLIRNKKASVGSES